MLAALRWLGLLALLVAGCTPQAPSSLALAQPRARRVDTGVAADDGARLVPPAAAGAARIEHVLRPLETPRGPGALHRFRIPLAQLRVSFIDLAYRKPLVDALGEHDLVINGGYWAYAGATRKIQGLLVVDGKSFSPRAPTLSGGVLVIEDAHARLHTSDWSGSTNQTALAIQCNPRLIANGAPISKLEPRRLAARTALCVRDHGSTLDAYLTAEDTRLTLQELAAFLLGEGCEDALNLDGGPSTAAVFREPDEPLKVGRGLELPYGLGFGYVAPEDHSFH
ncbi:MAG: hypothetical protein JWN04_3613 [Myxococcaceae bacterium]|nr:hypothetical protein [Myxococcaceae bacterium]